MQDLSISLSSVNRCLYLYEIDSFSVTMDDDTVDCSYNSKSQ